MKQAEVVTGANSESCDVCRIHEAESLDSVSPEQLAKAMASTSKACTVPRKCASSGLTKPSSASLSSEGPTDSPPQNVVKAPRRGFQPQRQISSCIPIARWRQNS